MLDVADATPGIAERLRNGTLLPFLGPGVTALSETAVPTSHEALAVWLGSRVALPRRARGNCWAAAQYIESFKHRVTLDRMMAEAFAHPVAPTPLHTAIARLAPAMVVDTWYDAALRSAFAGRSDWGEIQAASRAAPGEYRWYRAYDSTGTECSPAMADGWRTLIYKPHGCVTPFSNFLISDADYVEVLTEIDIQTPIPDTVKTRRADSGFLFLGCRFHDQALRTYARQIAKRSGGGHVVVIDGELSRNEERFMQELDASVIRRDLAGFAAELAELL
jgi:hypothetical protein